MAEESSYHDGDIVWVKMNKMWWPGEVHGTHRLPSDFFDQFKKPPLVVVKFFQEENYHYVNQLQQIARFNCAKKNEYIKKGLDLYYAKHSYMTVFPGDVAIAEKKTGGNPNIIYSKEFMPAVKPDKTTPVSASKGSTSRSRRSQQIQTSSPTILPRVMIKPDHDTRILVPSAPATSSLSSSSSSSSSSTTPTATDNKYKCTLCNYSTNRINTFVWHQKTHNSPKTPQTSTTFKTPIKQTPSTSTIKPDETNSTSSPMVQASEAENIPEIQEKVKALDMVADTESMGKQLESIDKEQEVVPTKAKGKRGRRPMQPKVTVKAHKTDNKLKNILDDWLDDEIGEAGSSELASEDKNGKCIMSDDEDDVKEECSSNKKLKFDSDSVSEANRTDENKLVPVSDDLSPKTATASVVDDKIENKSRSGRKSVKDEMIIGESPVHRNDNDVLNEEVKPHTRSSLRSGRTMVTSESSTITPKRRGRAKRGANDASKSELEVETKEVEAVLPVESETIENAHESSVDKVDDEVVNSTPVQVKEVNKSNSKTSRKGKPRRKEEIKLANNISVAVLVEKTNLCPSTDNESEQKVNPPAEDKEHTDVVHKKIRGMSHSSTEDHRKSTESIEASKTSEPINESDTNTDNDRMIIDEPESNEENGTAMETIDCNSQVEEDNEEKKTNIVPVVLEDIDLNVTSVSNSETMATTEKIIENFDINDTLDDQRVIPRCYERKSTPKKSLSTDQIDTPSISSIEDTILDDYESPSSSNLRQRAPKRYENTRNRRKSDRRTGSTDDFTATVKEIDDNYENDDIEEQKTIEVKTSPEEDDSKLSEVLNGSGKEDIDSTVHLDQSSENSKTSTPEKADTSKELDCFDFTEDECLKPPQVLNRRKRLPPGKVFELEDIDKIEEQRKIDEEAARIAQQREEENQKLHAELENLLNSTTPVTIPDIPIAPKVQENFPERRAEKDPEKVSVKGSDNKDRTLPPKERNKRIFKYRNRNRRPDPENTKIDCDVEENNKINDSLQPVSSDGHDAVTSVDAMEMEPNLQSNDLMSDTDTHKDPSAHDLKIEIAETLINFPLLPSQADVTEQSVEKVVAKPSTKRKESAKSTKSTKKVRSTTPVATVSKIVQNVSVEETTTATMTIDSTVPVIQQDPGEKLQPHADNFELQPSKRVTESVPSHLTINTAASSSVKDFSRVRLIQKIDNHSPAQSNEETADQKTHQLPLKKTLLLTQTECKSGIIRTPKKRKSQTDDDVPAFVSEVRKDHTDDTSEPIIEHTVAKKETKSFVVTKTIKKQIIGEPPKQNTSNVVADVHPIEVKEEIDSQQESIVIAQPITTSYTPIAGASKKCAIDSPVIVASNLIIETKPLATSAQKRTVTTSAIGNVLDNLAANRPCKIAPAKKVPPATYRKPADMTGLTTKQIGIDGNGNPVIAYTTIETETSTPIQSQEATFTITYNDPIPSTSQSVQSHSTPLQTNSGNQFVITSKGALITNKPFITTTHSTQFNQPTLTNRSNIQVHTQLISSPSSQVFQNQQQKQHQSPQSSQIIIQTKPPSHSLTQISSIASTGKKQPANRRRTAVNKTKIIEFASPESSSIDRTANTSNFTQIVNEDNTTAGKKRVVQRISKNQSATQQSSQQQIISNSEINHIGNAPVPPLVPLNDQSASISSRKQLPKQKQQTQMTLIQDPPQVHVDVVEQQQENMQEILALPGDTPGFGGPPGSYFLCKINEMGAYVPIDRQPLYLDVTDNTNLLKPNAPDEPVTGIQALAMDETEIPEQSPSMYQLNNEAERTNQAALSDQDANNPKYLINISDGQQLLVDQQSLMALANGEEFPQFVTSDGHQIILQSGQHDILSAIAFAEDVGLIAGQQILIPEEDLAVIQGQGGNQDILAAALAGTEAFSQEQFIDNVLIQSTNGVEDPMHYHTMPQPTNAVTNATNAVLTQPPIMSTLEQPSKTDIRISSNNSSMRCGQNLDQSLAVIGVTSNTNVPTSLELPITITNPAIAPKTTSSMTTIYPPTVTTEHDMDYDIFSSSLPITHHHLTQSLAINENYRTVNVINSIGDIDTDK